MVRNRGGTVICSRRDIRAYAKYTTSVMDFIDDVVVNKIENPEHPPPLLHYYERHYSALFHAIWVKKLPDFKEEMDSKTTEATELAGQAFATRAEMYTNASMQQLALRTAPLDTLMFGA